MGDDFATYAGRLAFAISAAKRRAPKTTPTRTEREANLPQGYVSRILDGTRTPGADFTRRLSNYLHVSFEWLLDGTGEPFAPASLPEPVVVASLPEPTVTIAPVPTDLRGTARRRFVEDAGARGAEALADATTFLQEVQINAAKGAGDWTAADFQQELERFFRTWKASRGTLRENPAAIFGRVGVEVVEPEEDDHDGNPWERPPLPRLPKKVGKKAAGKKPVGVVKPRTRGKR